VAELARPSLQLTVGGVLAPGCTILRSDIIQRKEESNEYALVRSRDKTQVTLTCSWLRRYRASDRGSLTNWERNWMMNHPVQGSAAVAFKAAGNRLDRVYRRHDAWLVIPVHDAFVFEAPLADLEEVAELTKRVMCDVVQEYFPQLHPQAEVNIGQPRCWNKDGHADAIERWMEDPM
jgi:DNA polymerase I-like protein with 3'-5' exonuclease and polymerase domains